MRAASNSLISDAAIRGGCKINGILHRDARGCEEECYISKKCYREVRRGGKVRSWRGGGWLGSWGSSGVGFGDGKKIGAHEVWINSIGGERA